MAAGTMQQAEPRDIDWPTAFSEVVTESLDELETRPDLFPERRVRSMRWRLVSWLEDNLDQLAKRTNYVLERIKSVLFPNQ